MLLLFAKELVNLIKSAEDNGKTGNDVDWASSGGGIGGADVAVIVVVLVMVAAALVVMAVLIFARYVQKSCHSHVRVSMAVSQYRVT